MIFPINRLVYVVGDLLSCNISSNKCRPSQLFVQLTKTQTRKNHIFWWPSQVYFLGISIIIQTVVHLFSECLRKKGKFYFTLADSSPGGILFLHTGWLCQSW
jgi:hypothetical protein